MSFNNICGVEHAKNQEYVHRVNVEKGWFDKPVTFLECIALLMTEVVEVADAHEDYGLHGGWSAGPQIASELADCYIRLIDDCSRFKADLGLITDIYKLSYERRAAYTFENACFGLIRRLRDIVEAFRIEGHKDIDKLGLNTSKCLAHFYLDLQDFCDGYGVNLMKAFDIKMAVNQTREYRHGNKHA